ncbi:MAG TPA: LptF/LptG family permease [Planctomycetota bacterium]|nr:LptF/LptG family permease [Planctomycetota bacterium]
MLGRRLDRHLLGSFLPPYLACLAGLGMLMVFFDLFERLDNCMQYVGQRPEGLVSALGTVGVFYLEQILSFAASYGGLSALAAAALTVAALSRNYELVAMRAGGISLRRILLPLLLFGALSGAAQLWLVESAVSSLSRPAAEAENAIHGRVVMRDVRIEEKRTHLTIWALDERGREEQIWSCRSRVTLNARLVEDRGRTVRELSLAVWEAGRPEHNYSLTAKTARWEDRFWKMEGGRFNILRGDQGWRPNCTRFRLGISPTEIDAGSRGLKGMATRDLYELRDDPDVRVELWRRWGLPLINLTLLLLGLPLAVAGGARGGKLLPLGMALILGAVYVLSLELGAEVARSSALFDLLARHEGARWLVAAGGASRMAVDLAMAAPMLLFLAAGAVLYWRMDRY